MDFQTDLFLGTALGTIIAFLLALPAVLLETSRRMQNMPLLIDVHAWRGKKLTEGEVFAVGLLIHLVIGALYGLLYTLFAANDWLFITHDPFSLKSLLIFAFFGWLVVNIIILPLIVGVGVFGRKEGKEVWIDSFLALFLEGLILWVVIQFYQPFFFMV